MKDYRVVEDSVQAGFALSRAPIQMMSGSYANGKTTAGAVKGLLLAADYPGSNGLIARATYPKLNDTIRKVVMEWCPAAAIKKKPTQDDNTLYLKNGSAINFRYIAQRGKTSADGTTTSNLLSATYDWIVVDQVEDPEIVHKDVIDLMGRLRGSTPYRPANDRFDKTMPRSGPRWLMLLCNPTRGWVYKELVAPLQRFHDHGVITDKLLCDPKTGVPIIEMYNGDIYSNKHNLPEDYIRNQEALLKGQARDRFLLGKWLAYEGLVYPDYDESTHVITKDQALAHLDDCMRRGVNVQMVEAYDFGIVSPTCYLLGFVDDWGRVIILDGFYEPDLHYTSHADRIYEIRERYAVFRVKWNDPINADPSIFRRQAVAKADATGDTVAKLLREQDLWLRPAANEITHGIAKVSGYLAVHPHVPHLVLEHSSGPLMYFNRDLMFIHDEFTEYYWKKDTFGDPIDMPQDHKDHAMDACKYLLTRLPDAASVTPPPEKRVREWLKWREESDDDRRYGTRV